ncbi:MAG: hypothetical protein OEY44_04175 [Candidatus Peregrinibacteria bacterium]|nr:hypothetical protein [Candidatus Peregrinibacteria bacterium]
MTREVETYKDFRTPASICRMTLEEALAANREFCGMQKQHAQKLWKRRGQRVKLSKLDFLVLIREEINPTLGLLKALHLLECERPRLSERKMRMHARDQLQIVQRVTRLIELTKGFADTMGLESKELTSYLRTLEQRIAPLIMRTEGQRAQEEYVG